MTESKPAFWLLRCPRCLAPLPRPIKVYGLQKMGMDRVSSFCGVCVGLSKERADAEYDRRLTQSTVVARGAETYEATART